MFVRLVQPASAGRGVGMRGWIRKRSSSSCTVLQRTPSNQDPSVSGHSGFRGARRGVDHELHSDHLFDPVVAKIGVLGSERCFRIDARYYRFDWFARIGIQIDARGLAQLDPANVAFGNETAQI